MEMRAICLIVTIAVCVGSGRAAQQPPLGSAGTISGVLKGDDGTALAGVAISLHKTGALPAAHPRRTSWATKTGPGGTFRFDGLSEGEYGLCAQAPGTVWLNPCEWGLNSPVAALSSSQRSAIVSMVLLKGAAVRIRVEDPGRLLAQYEGKTSGARLLFGIGGPTSSFHPASLTSQDSAGRDLQIVIPYDKTVNLFAVSPFFQLADSTGRQVSRTISTAIPITAPSGKAPEAVRFTVVAAGR